MPEQQHSNDPAPAAIPVSVNPSRASATQPTWDFAPMWELVRRLPAYARIAAGLARDPRVPGRSKALLAAGTIYLVSPIDLVPGIIPVAGQLDDLYVVLTGLQQAIRTSPALVVEEHFAAVGLAPSAVDRDLAIIREFVREGVVWSVRKGSRAIAGIANRVATLTQRARQERNQP